MDEPSTAPPKLPIRPTTPTTPSSPSAPPASSTPSASPAPSPLPPGTASGWQIKSEPARTLVRCARHREMDAFVTCDRCHQNWCNLCVRRGDQRGVKYWTCGCGGHCLELPTVAERRGESDPLEEGILQAFRYPFRGVGRWLLLLGTLLVGLVDLLFGGVLLWSVSALFSGDGSAGALMAKATIVSALVFIAIAGYIFATMLLVIRSTANGKNEMPLFPEFLSVSESMFAPFAQLFGLMLVAFGPGLLLLIAGGWLAVFGTVLLFVGAAWVPIALTGIAVLATFEGAHPRRAWAAMRLMPGTYVFAAALFFASMGLAVGGSFLAAGLPVIGHWVRAFLLQYFAIVGARTLGLAYRHHAKALGWM